MTADQFGHLDYLANLETFRPRLDALREVFVVGDRVRRHPALRRRWPAADPIDGPAPTDPSRPRSSRTPRARPPTRRGSCTRTARSGSRSASSAPSRPRADCPSLVGAPVGHGIGMLAALLIPVWRRDPIQLIDVWDPARVLATMLEEGITSGNGATYFLISLLDHPDFTDAHRRLMPYIGLGGSAVPAAVGERCARAGDLDGAELRVTEHPSITGMHHDAPSDKKLHTDGKALPGVELELRDDDGRVVDVGTPGEIWSKGPDCFVGYTDPALTGAAFDADGWFATGDIGVLDVDGYLTIVDRKKDIIIRGGENVSALEVEEQLLRIPGVAEAAVVAAPDVRLGEHGCAFVRMQPGTAAPSLEVLRDHLDPVGLARQKWPEEIRGIDEFPARRRARCRSSCSANGYETPPPSRRLPGAPLRVAAPGRGQPLDEQGALNLSRRGRAGERLDELDAARLLERREPSRAVGTERVDA